MQASEIERRLTAPGAFDMLQATGLEFGEIPTQPAAVLVPIVLHHEPAILLTARAQHLRRHAGQVAFPGGRLEPGESPEEAALRETEEEIGLPRDWPRILGRMPQHLTGTGYAVTPVLGLITPGFTLAPDANEVEEAFELPLAVLLDPEAPRREAREWKGKLREYWVWPHERHYIWGATASILINLARVLRA